MKSFRQFLKEEKDKEFDSFVEETLTTNKIPSIKAKDFLVPEYNYTGIIYRVVFHPKPTIERYFSDTEIDTKGITKYVSSKFNHDRYVFFSKSLEGIKALIDYPNLFNINENQIGVIFSVKPAASIDLTKYAGNNIEVKERLQDTEEVLSFEDINIRNIDALYLYDEDSGWHFITDFNNRERPTKEPITNDEEDNTEETPEIKPEEEEETKEK